MFCFQKHLNIFLGWVGRHFFFFCKKSKKKIIQNTLKIEEKFSDVPNKFRDGPKKVGSVGFLETRPFFRGLIFPFTECYQIFLKIL